jgi:manganese transport system ATP-binding protein
VRYGEHVALRDVSLDIGQGRVVALLGPNGAGKTTLFKALVGLLKTDAGELRVEGRERRGRQTAVAYVPQVGDVEPNYPVTVQDVVLMGRYGHLGWLKRPGAEDRGIAQAAMARVDIADLAERPFGALSGGQRQRVFLARALAQQARIFLMDEPFTGVDARTQEVVFDVLRELRQQGRTLLVATHDLASVPVFCDEAVLVNRTIVAHGPLSEVFRPEPLQRTFGGRLVLLEGAMAFTPAATYVPPSAEVGL